MYSVWVSWHDMFCIFQSPNNCRGPMSCEFFRGTLQMTRGLCICSFLLCRWHGSLRFFGMSDYSHVICRYYICIYTYMYTYMQICLYIHIYIYMYICIYIYMCVYIYIFAYVFIYTYVYICAYICIYICLCIYIYMYIYVWIHVYMIYVYICIYMYTGRPKDRILYS